MRRQSSPITSAKQLLESRDLLARHMPETNIPLEEPCWVQPRVVDELYQACGRNFWRLWRVIKEYNRRHAARPLYPFKLGERVGICTEAGFRGFWSNWTEEMTDQYRRWLYAGRHRRALPAGLAHRMPVI